MRVVHGGNRFSWRLGLGWRIHGTFIGRARCEVPIITGSQVLKASTQRGAPVPQFGASQLVVHACILVSVRYLKQTTRGRQFLPLSAKRRGDKIVSAPPRMSFLLDNTFAYQQITISFTPISSSSCGTCIAHRTFDLPHVGTVNGLKTILLTASHPHGQPKRYHRSSDHG
ncbi:hypothetical protein K443DRAFT_674400 [Laccaria amethystina LaAM-08-1]|uniref:Uncharacterized protein n=1 Tax=Laccaria amethystina LaAM-08-1 TaxID=1095629 RepID=A0A0C9XXS9_9AGAR|nr:hypothetical protein K443DRAFT_674400 [Laccaria amethystina LaAM-08-1]